MYIGYSQSILNDLQNWFDQYHQKKSFDIVAADETKKLELVKCKLKNVIDTKSLLDTYNRELK